MSHGTLYSTLKLIAPLREAVRWARRLLERFRWDVWIVTGEERSSGELITMFFSGQIENCNYITRLIFRESSIETRHKKMWSWNAFGVLDRAAVPYALIFIQVEQLTRSLAVRHRCFVIPSWIAGELDVARALESRRGNESVKTDLRNIKRNRFTYKVTRDHGEMERFYSTMYLPYVRQNHGSRAFVATLEELRREATKGAELLLVEQDGKTVAGVYLGIHDSERIDALELGVSGGDHGLVKMGALAAIYYYALVHAAEGRYARLFLGGARPFLNDGPLQYKKKWGLRITGRLRTLPDLLVFQPRLGSAAVKSFLKNNPFVYEELDMFRAAVFLDTDKQPPLPEETIQQLRKAYCLPGLGGLSVFSIDREGGLEVLPGIASLPRATAGTETEPAA